MRDPQRTVKGILAGAEKAILAKGIANATIEDVAREASVSKGGVLHHFPNKEAILVGLLQDLIARFEADIESYRSQDPDSKGAFTRAFLRATIKPGAQCVDLFSALSSVFCNTPALLDLQRESNAKWQQQMENDGIDPVHAAIVRFAADGLWFARVHDMGVPSEKIRQSIIDKLLALTHGKTLAK
jgi:AcrR family transcriptional regulator